jgi:hypothetical protein
METELAKLNSILSKKEYLTFLITGNDSDDDGEIVKRLDTQHRLNENANHVIQLTDFVGWSNFPNVDKTNNKFYYKTAAKDPFKTLTVPSGAFNLDNYNWEIKKLIKSNGDNPDNITISGDAAQSKAIVTLKGGYQVLFKKDKTWRSRLGFDAVDLDKDGENFSQNNANITDILNILIHCSLASGYYINGKASNIIYSIPNEQAPGTIITIREHKKIRCFLNTKVFDEIRIKFTDQDLRPITFNKENVSVEIHIEQV